MKCEKDKVWRNRSEATVGEQCTQARAVLLSVIHEFYSLRGIPWTQPN